MINEFLINVVEVVNRFILLLLLLLLLSLLLLYEKKTLFDI